MPPPKESRGSRAATPRVWAALAAAALLAGCGREPLAQEARVVAVAKVARMRLENSMTLQGEFYPFQDVMIHAKVSGYVNPIRVDIGDRVKAGELLATLEVPELRDQLDGARAAARRAEAEHSIAHLSYQRLVEVNRSHPDLVAQQDLDDAAARDAASEAALATARAEADRYQTLSDYTRVLAPFDGVITRRLVDNGSLVEAGTSSNTGPIVDLAEDDLLRLRFPVPEAETPLIRNEGKVTVTVDALHRTFSGRIARAAWEIDRSTRTMIVEVDVPNAEGQLKAGMYASVTLATQASGSALSVPLQALGQNDPPTVLVVGQDGAIEARSVVVGMRTASMAEVRSGLAEGELVVLGDRSGLAQGAVVTPKFVEIPSEAAPKSP
jgi:RND family efflux transporter MFP subunit